ncbi:hypothetical protein QBC35DRAFT_448858 [Podospora australis]|uniref:HNH nuclease domain-containing protein n=1 Tax=Podospora australis TaxID=1536484 RepID=A0AAN7AMJ1_9PEZI|nr:hypothetical protein QBC35DRAFT_448858 [Podospora australis]
MDLDRPIEVSYAGNFHTTWDGRTLELLPPPWSPLTPDHLIDDVVPHTKAESRVRFVRWIKKEIETVKESELVGGRQPNLDNRKSLRSLYGLLAIAQDRDAFPSCINPRIIRSFFKEANAQGDAILELSDVFDEFRGSLLNNVESLAEFSLTNNVSPSEDRTAADVGAQKEVKTWYDECCILTGCDSPGEPAHIIDVNKELKDGDLATYWKKLRSFYPSLARLDTLVVQGQENANILPFGVEPYRYFNKLNRLALRPISIQQTHRAYSCR